MAKRRREHVCQLEINGGPLDRTEPFIGFEHAERRTPRVMPRRTHLARQSLQDRQIVSVPGDGAHPFRQVVTIKIHGEGIFPLFRFQLLLTEAGRYQRIRMQSVSLMDEDEPSRRFACG